MKKSTTLRERFDANWVEDPKTGCHVWTRGRHPKGYGQMRGASRGARAHRLAWELRHGPVPEGMLVLHKCDNPPCVNADHLFLGTNADNLKDAYAKGRLPHFRPGSGEAKLNESAAREIIADYGRGATQRGLAARFGVSRASVRDVLRGRSYAQAATDEEREAAATGRPETPRGCPARRYGEEHHCAKLTWGKVDEIRAAAAAGASKSSLRRKYGVSAPTIYAVIDGKTWMRRPE